LGSCRWLSGIGKRGDCGGRVELDSSLLKQLCMFAWKAKHSGGGKGVPVGYNTLKLSLDGGKRKEGKITDLAGLPLCYPPLSRSSGAT